MPERRLETVRTSGLRVQAHQQTVARLAERIERDQA